MDRIIEIKVNGSYLTKDNDYAGVQHEANAKTLRIEFDPGWDGYAKTVTFWNALGENPVKRILTADLLEDLSDNTRIYLCQIPGEALTEEGVCSFVIDGYVDGKRQRSIEATLKVSPAPYAEDASEPTDPTPSQAEQLQVQIDALLQDVSAEADRAETAKENAEKAQQAAEAAQSEADKSAATASVAATIASIRCDEAKEAAEAAQTARSAAETAQGKAETAKSEAETAQGKAETAQQAAETARSEADSFAKTASGAATIASLRCDEAKEAAQAAQTAQGAAETAQGKAEEAQVAAEAAESAAAKSQNAAYYNEQNAKGYAEGGSLYEVQEDGIAFATTGHLGAKDYRDQAQVYTEGGMTEWNPHDFTTGDIMMSSGAKNFAEKAKAFTVGGTYKEYGPKFSGGHGWEEHTVEKGAAQYAEEASDSAAAAEISAEDAARSAQSVNPEKLAADIAAKGDNLEFDSETNLLWLTSNGERIGDGIKVATTGGGGGGGESNNAVLTLKNTTGWTYKSMGMGAACPVSFEWSSIEDGMETGGGTLRITVGTTVKHTSQIRQGAHTMDIGSYLAAGSNTVKINVTDVYGNSRSIIFDLTVVELTLTSTFDASKVQTGAFKFPYTPTAAVEKTMHVKVDGTELTPVTVTTSGRELNYNIPAQSHGSHTIEAWFTAKVNEDDAESNRLHYTIICTEEGNHTPIIAVDWRTFTVEQYATLAIPYRVYDPVSLTAQVSLHSGETGESRSLSVDRTKQTWSYRPETVGALNLTLTCVGGDTTAAAASVTLAMTVTETKIEVDAETESLSLHLSSYGRSNREENPAQWSYGNVAANMTGFNFTSDGWMEDEDGITVLRVGGDARVEIPVQIFAEDFRTTGKTIEIEFASRSVLDYDAIIATCWTAGRGFEITAQQATLKSEKSDVTTRYKEDDHLRLSFVIEKRSGNRLIIGYVNGIISGMVQYPDNDDFSQAVPVTITLGSNDCTIDVYNIRVYESDLSRFQMLDNWIADTQELGEKMDRYQRNDIFNDYGQILPDTLRPEQRYLILSSPVLPTYKGDKKTCSGQYVDPVNTDRSFTFEGAEIDVQGTSSQFYYVKNFKIKFKGGFQMPNGETAEAYAMNAQAVPTNEFTFKADVASSEGANNVVLAELYNDLCPVKTPAQEDDPRVRQCIEGHPIVVFHDDGSGPKFIGKYNFNNDKGTPEVFGFVPGDESWEIKENGNALVSFKSGDFTNWETAFEARYPDKNTDITRLKQFVTWVASTDVTGKTGTTRTTRLNKFKNEIGSWCNVEDAIFYYLFTLIFLCIDQREKNAFPTYNAEMAKWIWLFYDADSSLGTDNKGNLTFEYWMEDIDYTIAGDPVFNGQNNVFWSNLRECFGEEIKAEYRRLRTELGKDGKPLLSYEKVNELFTAHQSQWCEAIYNEDAWRKAVEPLEKIGDPQYLPMQQGKKEQHFKHWMYNRFRYLDSWAETGAALDDENRIMMRAHAQGNLSLTSYINMYGQVYYNSARSENRMVRDQAYVFPWTAQGAEDAVIGVNSAPMITSLGDLSPLMLEYCHIQYASHLTELKVGDAASSYVNDNFVALTLGNNKLLRKLDVRNCTALTQAVDASGCTNIEEVYFDGTYIAGLSLPNGGILKKLHLPASITDLTLCNQPKLEEFVLPSYGNISTLRLENVPACVDSWAILHQIPANSRVRMVGFDWTQDSPEAVLELYDYLDTMRGLDENGNNVAKAQMQGTIRIDSLTGGQLNEMQSRYPSIRIEYQHITAYVYFYDETGATLLYTAPVNGEEDVAYGGPAQTKAATAQYTYTFAGWSLTPGGTANANALKAVTADRNVYAAFTGTVRTYTVTWKNGSTTLETDTNVPYGTTPVYNGSEPVYNGSGDPAKYMFSGWSPAVGAVKGDATYTAVFAYTGYVYAELLDRSITSIESNVTTVGSYAAYACKKLTSVKLPAATRVGGSAFQSCTALKTVDLPAVTKLDGTSTFRGCSALTTFILRTEQVAHLSYNNSFMTTPIKAGGTGYIYVPAALVDSYKAATNWSTYASQIRAIEDYPEAWDPYSWESVNYHIEQGDYATFYKIGDSVPLDLGDEGVVHMQIAAFDTDDLADGTGKAPITFVAKELLATDRRMNPARAGSTGAYTEGTGSVGGWEKSEMRAYLNDTIKPMIPAAVASMIRSVTKTQDAFDSTGTLITQTTTDDVWIPATSEVYNQAYTYKDLFPDNDSRKKQKVGETDARSWWNRTAPSTRSDQFMGISASGSLANVAATNSYGICLCFCVGEKEG